MWTPNPNRNPITQGDAERRDLERRLGHEHGPLPSGLPSLMKGTQKDPSPLPCDNIAKVDYVQPGLMAPTLNFLLAEL